MQSDLFNEQGSTQEALAPTVSTLRQVPLRRETPEQRATRRIVQILKDGHPVVVAFSSGKDSSCLAGLVLNSAAGLIRNRIPVPPVCVVHSNTGVEQPEVARLAMDELAKMKVFAANHGINLEVKIGYPTLSASFPVRVIGGRALPAFPDSRGDCSTDWKVAVNTRLLNETFSALHKRPDLKQPVVMTGVRQTESNARDQKIAKRGETAEGLWTNELGRLRSSPILDWDVDDVWEYIGLCSAGVIPSYSDFGEVMRIYRDAGGSSCVIVADMKAAATSKPCGTRTGSSAPGSPMTSRWPR